MKSKDALLKKFCRRAVELGAKDAKVISAKTVVTAAWVRMKCQFGCSGYAQSLTCPPYSPPPEETRAVLGCYKKAILIHGDGKKRVTDIVCVLEREAFLAGFYCAFGMGSGPCRFCDTCALKPGKCRHPDEARPSMEACGIDVYATARDNGFPIRVVTCRTDQRNHYGLVLLE